MNSDQSLILQPSGRLVALILAALAAIGCRPQDRIEAYETPKKAVKPAPDRMLGAIAFQQDAAWFFKATAPQADAQALEPSFRALLGSVTFAEDGKPQWKLPEGWTKSDVQVQLRHATLNAKVGEETVEVTVSTLPWDGEDANNFVLRNVNRWRGQLGVRPALLVELLRDQQSVEIGTGEEAILVLLDGRQNRRSRMPAGHPSVGPAGPAGPVAGPAAGPDPGPSAGPNPGPGTDPRAPSAAPTINFATPEGWTPGRVGGMRKAAFTVANDANQAEITVIDLGPMAGTLGENVNRWRGQVLLDNVSDAEIEKAAKDVDIGGVKGKYVELVGPRDTILGVIASTPTKMWFIKLRGEKSLAEAEKKRFEQFVQSLELP